MEYNQNYHKTLHSYLESNPDYYLLRARLAFLRYFSSIKDVKTKKILEYGCGMGQNIFLLKNASGYDISQFALDFCSKKRIKTFKDKSKIPSNYFDIILNSHILEHLDNPLGHILFMREKLKKGGMLITVIPREKQHNCPLSPEMISNHLYCWNFRAINNLLDKAGFKVIKNKQFFNAGFNKLKIFSKFSINLYSSMLYIAGRIFNEGELMIFAIKK